MKVYTMKIIKLIVKICQFFSCCNDNYDLQSFTCFEGLNKVLFVSGVLQVSGGSEWQQDCLACLLKLLCQLGMTQTTEPGKSKRKRCSKSDKMSIPKLSQVNIKLLVSMVIFYVSITGLL